MKKDEFTDRINDLGDYFQKDLKEGFLQQWYNEFGWLAPFQLDIVIRAAKRECERFPPGKFVHGEIRSHNFSRPGEEDRVEEVQDFVTVVCSCGEAFTAKKKALAMPGAYFPMYGNRKIGIKKGCLGCNRLYSGEMILKFVKKEIAEIPKSEKREPDAKPIPREQGPVVEKMLDELESKVDANNDLPF